MPFYGPGALAHLPTGKKFPLVLNVGLCRTGSHSIKIALEELLGGKVHHGFDLADASSKQDIEFWMKVRKMEETNQDWRDFVERNNYVGLVDVPCSVNFKKILRAFPDAKVILSVREGTDWFKSFEAMAVNHTDSRESIWFEILRIISGYSEIFAVTNHCAKYQKLDGCDDSMMSAFNKGLHSSEKLLRDWEAEVVRAVPQEKLLIFSVLNGYGPLCQFLGVPVPNQSFPRSNNRIEYEQRISSYFYRPKVILRTILVGTFSILACSCLGRIMPLFGNSIFSRFKIMKF